MGKKHYYTPEEEEIIRKYYPTMETSELANILGVSVLSCFNKAERMGLCKDPDWLRTSRSEKARDNIVYLQQHWFKKGHTPYNKGKKLPEVVRKKLEKTMFKKGTIPPNTMYDGAESVRKDKNGKEYIYVRVSAGNWVAKHVQIWEEAHGKVPRGYNVIFKDGNTRNLSLENLEMLSNAELMLRNSLHNNYPPEIARLVQLKGALKRQINKHSKKRNYGSIGKTEEHDQ